MHCWLTCLVLKHMGEVLLHSLGIIMQLPNSIKALLCHVLLQLLSSCYSAEGAVDLCHCVARLLQVAVDVLQVLLCMLCTAVEGVDHVFCELLKVLALKEEAHSAGICRMLRGRSRQRQEKK